MANLTTTQALKQARELIAEFNDHKLMQERRAVVDTSSYEVALDLTSEVPTALLVGEVPLVVGDDHGPPAEHVAGPYQHRKAYLPGHAAGLDNFCWCDPVASAKNPEGAHHLAQLVRGGAGPWLAAAAGLLAGAATGAAPLAGLAPFLPILAIALPLLLKARSAAVPVKISRLMVASERYT